VNARTDTPLDDAGVDNDPDDLRDEGRCSSDPLRYLVLLALAATAVFGVLWLLDALGVG
jgi:hypothetical protein